MNRGRKLVDRSCPPRFVMSPKKLFKWSFRCRLCCSCAHSDLEQDISLESKPDTLPVSLGATKRDSDAVLSHSHRGFSPVSKQGPKNRTVSTVFPRGNSTRGPKPLKTVLRILQGCTPG